nr:porphobilinogen synthase [Burkholderiales bacterium]
GISDDNGYVLNDLTNEILVKQALCHAQAGADFVCPSDMMDGRVLKIREALDQHGFVNTGIMAYSAKYASSFYGPFREATGAGRSLGVDGKKNYQMNPANANEAVHEARLDLYEGADIIMIKPGLPYLDIIYRVKSALKKPTAVYHVSGEYAMLKYASMAEKGTVLDYNRAIMEIMLCFKRAGADIIWTYAALEVARLLKSGVEI